MLLTKLLTKSFSFVISFTNKGTPQAYIDLLCELLLTSWSKFQCSLCLGNRFIIYFSYSVSPLDEEDDEADDLSDLDIGDDGLQDNDLDGVCRTPGPSCFIVSLA